MKAIDIDWRGDKEARPSLGCRSGGWLVLLTGVEEEGEDSWKESLKEKCS
jgi:hypothetical protein